MKKEDKALLIDSLVEQLNNYPHFYVVDVTALDSQTTSDLRRACFKNDIKLQVVKNTLFIKALERVGNEEFEALKPILKNTTGIMFCQVANQPAKLIKSFGKDLHRSRSAQRSGIYQEQERTHCRGCFYARGSCQQRAVSTRWWHYHSRIA